MQRPQYFSQHFLTNTKQQVVTTCYLWKKNNYSDIFKQKTKKNLKPRICYKKNIMNVAFLKKIRIIIRVELANFY